VRPGAFFSFVPAKEHFSSQPQGVVLQRFEREPIFFEKKPVKFFVLKTKTIQICLINAALLVAQRRGGR